MEKNIARICVPVCVKRASELTDGIRRASEVADIIELRLDCLNQPELRLAINSLPYLLEGASKPFILTFRPREEGGYREIDLNERLNFWRHINESPARAAGFSDIEASLLKSLSNAPVKLGRESLICSFHDFAQVHSDLEEIYERMAATPARMLKIAVQADDAIDCLPVVRLLDRARRDGREIIAIAMGQAGVATRILGPSRGAFLTYGSLDDESSTAPGQLTVEELREVYRIDQINQQTEIMGLIGNPVGHSISPQIQNAAFAAAETDAVYIPFEVRDLTAFMRRMAHPRSREINWKMRGLSVTAPHKSAIMQHLDWIEPAAKEIGAVNTVVVEADELRGFNTDASGFIEPLRKPFGSLEGSRCAIIGAGGGAKSAVWALQREGASVTLFARDPEAARRLAEKCGINCSALTGAAFNNFDLVVNATPVGTRGPSEGETVAAAEQLRGVRVVYDLVYNPVETEFIRQARAAGCEVLGGLEMLIAQACEQFKLWTGRNAPEETMRAAAIKSLARPERGHPAGILLGS